MLDCALSPWLITITAAVSNVQRLRLHLVRFLPARVIFAALILFALLAVTFPLNSGSAASACQRDCCAGRAPHAAGSCMTGSCHARLKTKRGAPAQFVAGTKGEELCGLSTRPAVVATRLAAANLSAHRTNNHRLTQPELAVTAVGKPCLEHCGGLASSFANAKQQRKISFGRAHSLRPRTVSNRGYVFVNSVESRAGLGQPSIPRGPPSSLHDTPLIVADGIAGSPVSRFEETRFRAFHLHKEFPD